MQWRDQKCTACQVGAPLVEAAAIEQFLAEHQGWKLLEINNVPRLQRQYQFKDYAQTLNFALKVGELAEMEDHHPEITISWGKAMISWWTHKIEGIHQNDLIMAAKTDALLLASD